MQDIIQPNPIKTHSKRKALIIAYVLFAALLIIIMYMYKYMYKRDEVSPIVELQGLTEVSTPSTTTPQEQYNELMMLRDGNQNSNQ